MHRTIQPLALLTATALLSSLLAVFLTRQITTFGSWQGIGTPTLVYIAAWYAVFLVGFLVPHPLLSQEPNGSIAALNTWVIVLAIAAAAGAAVLTYEFAIVRGYGFSTQVSELRVIQVNAASSGFIGSWLGGLGRLLVSAIVVAWVTVCLQWPSIRWKSLLVVAIATAAVFAYQAKFEGGRIFSTAAIVAALFACFIAYVAQEGLRLRAKTILQFSIPAFLLIAMFVAVTVYSMQVFTTRGDYTAERTSVSDKQNNSGAHPQGTLHPASTYAQIFTKFASGFEIRVALPDPEKFDARDFSLAMAWIYMTHGPNEFDRIYRLDNLKLAMGFYQFSQVAQILSKLTGKDLRYDLAANLPNIGTYITLPGASYLDFGAVFGLVFAAMLGFGLRVGLSAAVLQPGSPIGASAPLIFILVLAGPVTSLVPNFWPCFVWIGLMMFSVVVRKLKPAFS